MSGFVKNMETIDLFETCSAIHYLMARAGRCEIENGSRSHHLTLLHMYQINSD